jgi:hypothetical protein
MALHDPGTIEEGDPSTIRAEADELRTVAANIHTVAEMLRMVSTKGVWDSCSGTIFEDEVGSTPDDLFAIANRLADTERIIRPYADRLEESQATLERLRGRYEENVRISEERKAKLATLTPQDPEYAIVEREYRAAASSREMNKRGFEREAEEASADERTMATSLAAVGSELSDEAGYNGFEMASRTGRSRLFNNAFVDLTPWGKPAAVVTAADPLGRLGRRAVYGEGSYRDVGLTTVLTAADILVPGSRRIEARDATRASRRADELKGISAADRSTNPIAHRRLATNTRIWAQHQVATGKVRAKHKVTDTLADKTGIRLVDDMVTDWSAVAGAGRVRRSGYALKYSVKVTNKTTAQVSSVQSAADKVGAVTESDEARRERRAREEAEERRQETERRRRESRVEGIRSRPITSPVP